MQTIFPNYLNQLLRSSLVVFLPQPLTQTSGFLTRVDMLILLQLYAKTLFKYPKHTPQPTLTKTRYLPQYSFFIYFADRLNNLYQMKHKAKTSSMVPNIYELDELPFLKRQTHQWQHSKDKQNFVSMLRGLTYQLKDVMSKMLVFSFSLQKKDKKRERYLHLLTEREIVTLEQYYQLLNENVDQKEFSLEVERIKTFQRQVYSRVENYLGKNLIKFENKKDYLEFNVYQQRQQFFLKAAFSNYHYQLEYSAISETHQQLDAYPITSTLVKHHLRQRYNQLQSILNSLPLSKDIDSFYKTFYDDVYFLYDQFILKLQVFHNYPLLRMKTFVPIKFSDFKTGKSLQGPIFSSANPECMFGHFHGYNADSTKLVQGQHCQSCHFYLQQLQQNQLLMMLRDNVLNPERCDIFYCPEYNRFKLLGKTPITIEQWEGQMAVEKVVYRTTLKYLNYYHFRTNLKKITNKERLTFYPTQQEEEFPLNFNMLNRKIPIMDPARGRYCQHYAFTDLRLYYLNFDPADRTYSCPIPGCTQKMADSDLLFLKEVAVLIDYAKFKCQDWPELFETVMIRIQNHKRKLSVVYKARQQGQIVTKSDELVDFYKTLADPYIPFPQYTLGIKEKERRAKIDQYMFGGLRSQMKEEQQFDEQQEDMDESY